LLSDSSKWRETRDQTLTSLDNFADKVSVLELLTKAKMSFEQRL
jgi:hypothetical protein